MSNEKTILILNSGKKRVLDIRGELTKNSLGLTPEGREPWEDAKEIIIGTNVTRIGSECFHDLEGFYAKRFEVMEKVTIPNTVKSIGYLAFGNQKNLKSINIPNSVTFIDYWSFKNCESLSSVTIGNGVRNINYRAFEDCVSLKSMDIPNSVTYIGNYVFKNCTSLESVTIGNGVININYQAFVNCTSLKSVTIGNGVRNIGYQAFMDCTSLESVFIGNSVINIIYYAFMNCKSLKSLIIPNSVTSIDPDAFLNSGIETLYFTKLPRRMFVGIQTIGGKKLEVILNQLEIIHDGPIYLDKGPNIILDFFDKNNFSFTIKSSGSSINYIKNIDIDDVDFTVDNSKINFDKVGTYIITITAEIKGFLAPRYYGLRATRNRKVYVVPNELKINHDGPIYLTQGQNIFDFIGMNNFTFTLESKTSAKLIDNADVDYEIDSSEIDFGNVGKYIITINAKYDGLKATRNRQVYVITKKNPGIILNKDIIGVKKNQPFNPTIIVKDPDYILQSSDYKTTFTKIDTSKIGFRYSTLTAIDKFGNKSEKRMDVIISDRPPKIEFVGKDVLRIKRNTILNPEITVTDPDGIVPQKDIKVVYSGIDTRYSSSYTITIKATDPYGNFSTKERKVIVMEDSNNVSLQSITLNINPQSQEDNLKINSVNMTGGTFLIDYFPLINNDESVYDIRNEKSFYDAQINLYKKNDIIKTLEKSPDEIFTKKLDNTLGIKYRFSKLSDDTFNFSQKFFDSKSSEIYESTDIIKYIQYLFIKDINHNISDEETEELINGVKLLVESKGSNLFPSSERIKLDNNFYNIPVAQLNFKELNNISNTTNFNVEKTNEKEILFSLKKIPDIMPWLNDKTYAEKYSINVKDTYFSYGFSFDVSEYNIKISELTSYIENNGNKNVFNIEKVSTGFNNVGNGLLLNYYLNNDLDDKSGVFYGFDNMSAESPFDIFKKNRIGETWLGDLFNGIFSDYEMLRIKYNTLNEYLNRAKKGLKDTSQTLYTYMELIKSFLEARYLANFMYLNTYKNGKIEKIKLADLVAEGDGYKGVELDKEYPLSQIFNPKRNMETTKYTAEFKSDVYKFATFDPNYKSNLEKLEKLGLTKKSKVVKQTRQEVVGGEAAEIFPKAATDSFDYGSLSVPNENAEASMVNQTKPKAGNSALGVEALKNSTTSILNSAIGYQALLNTNSSNNTAMGTKVGPTLKSGKKNVLLGNETDVSSENAINQVVIGTKAKGVANHTMVFGGTTTKSDNKYDSKVTALDSLDPGVTNHTDLGSTDYKFSSLYVSTLNNGIDFTLPTSHPKDDGYLLRRNEDGNLEWSKPTLNKIIIKSGSKHTVTSSGNLASISITDILEGNGRLLVDANTNSIVFTSTAAVMIKKLGLKHDGDYISNSFIAKIGSSMLVSGGEIITATDSSNITISKDDIEFDGIKTNMSTVLMFIRKSSTSLEIKFDGHMN